ncbi:MAG: hypothetical protein QNJ44_24160 [Rhodobacter sp.]|nr:hypothetical protein [Rhodobacter sp.]
MFSFAQFAMARPWLAATLVAAVLLPGHAAAQAIGCVQGQTQAALSELRSYLSASPVPATMHEAADSGCITCHGDAGRLIGMVKPPEAPPEDGCASAPSRPPFLGSFVNADFPKTVHGQLGCTTCHGGDASAADMAAHANLKDANASCALCHADQVAKFETSLHNTLGGMAHALTLRSGADNFAALDHAWENDCASCHADCGDCHLSLPEAVGGGLIRGHDVMARAPMEDSCALCHGSRAGGEYLGHFDGIEPDIHFEKGMHCLDCHKNDLHGDGTHYDTRWQVANRAQCTDCHKLDLQAAIPIHDIDHADLACQVCHAQPYQNCFDCHTGEEDGRYFRRAGAKELLLKLGKNTDPDYPYDVVALRNNPVARESFAYLGEGLLPDFDAHPTWKTAAPHNIRRITKQNAKCENCHSDPELFLQPEDLDPNGSAANAGSILTKN